MAVEDVDMDSLKKIDASEVAKHVARDDLYVVIHKMVYNISQFINEHPGGEEVLLDVAGQDATSAFEDIGHSDDARNILKNFLVGELEGVANMEQSASTNNCYTYNSEHNSNMKMYITAIIMVLLALLLYIFVF